MIKIAAAAAAAVLLALAAAGYWYFLSAPELPLGPGPLVAFGDSLTYGTGAPPGGDYPSLLAARLGRPILNKGVPGDTTVTALVRLEQDVLYERPSLVIVFLGGNDIIQNLPSEQVGVNLETIVRRIKEAGGKVLLVSVLGGLNTSRYGRVFADIADGEDVRYVPDVLRGIRGDRTLMADEVHPNEAGYVVVADRIYPALRAMAR